jgi:hypothetical protein
MLPPFEQHQIIAFCGFPVDLVIRIILAGRGTKASSMCFFLKQQPKGGKRWHLTVA